MPRAARGNSPLCLTPVSGARQTWARETRRSPTQPRRVAAAGVREERVLSGEDPKPRLRPIEAIPTIHEGRSCIILRDPEGFSENPLVVSDRAAFLLGFMDGEHTLLDIQAAYARRFGDLIFSDDIRKLLRQLDDALLLENDRFRAKKEESERAYHEMKTRPAVHLSALDADPATWKRWMDGFFASAGDPESPPPKGRIRGLIVPHIDLRLGGPVCAAGWKTIDRSEPPALAVLLGTCHATLRTLVAATEKDFDTPLGSVSTDRRFLRELDRAAGGLFEDELAHRREHTIEFQALFVRRLFGRKTKIAPLLCSYAWPHLEPDAPPEERGRIEKTIDAMRAIFEHREESVLLVASADLSHVGPRYGDEAAPSSGERRILETSDRAFIDSILAVDAGALTRRMKRTGDRTRICGYSPIHFLLSALDQGKGALLRYEQAVMGEEGSIVSFAAIALS